MIQTFYIYTGYCYSYLDVLNMLQPLYVFIIFVLKKNVIDVILGRDKKRTVSKTTKSKQKIQKPRDFASANTNAEAIEDKAKPQNDDRLQDKNR